MPLQRRYSVTGQQPPDDAAAMKPHSPKLQALDTSVQTASCNLCEAGGDSDKHCSGPAESDNPIENGTGDRGRKSAHHTTVRTSSKRSATQLPSPNTPSSHELPTKIARLGLELDPDGMDLDDDDDEGNFSDPYPDASHWSLSSSYGDSSSPSPPSSPSTTSCSLPDEPIIEPLDHDTPNDIAVEDLALSPPPSFEDHVPLTLLTLPPEIRHQIYRNLPDLVLPQPLIYCLSTFANQMQHPLASVSRLIRAEALAIFYSYNTWIIKLEFKMMYEAFQDWIIRLGDGAGQLRLVTIAVRGRHFKPRTSHTNTASLAIANGQVVPPAEAYHPPDGDASFNINLSEKYPGGRVELVRNDGTPEAGEAARLYLAQHVAYLWEKRRTGMLNGQDWVNMVDEFLVFSGWF